MTLQPHSLRLEVAAVQQQFHLLRTFPLRVRSRRWLRALAHAQPRRNEQPLLAKNFCKFYPFGDMFGIYSHICCHGLSYSQSGMPPMFSGLAKCPKKGPEQLNLSEASTSTASQ
jgi:hypothetical protein